MHIVPFLIACVAALAFLLNWAETQPRRFASIPLGLCLLTIALILVFVIQTGENFVRIT